VSSKSVALRTYNQSQPLVALLTEELVKPVIHTTHENTQKNLQNTATQGMDITTPPAIDG